MWLPSIHERFMMENNPQYQHRVNEGSHIGLPLHCVTSKVLSLAVFTKTTVEDCITKGGSVW
jgi:hypothetical protein